MTFREAALALHGAGLSVLPVSSDGSKRPSIAWNDHQQRLAHPGEIDSWFGPHRGIGVVCGAVSGNLEMLEVEGRAVDLVPRLAALITEAGHVDLWQRLCTGYLERSPSGGLHWLFRVDGTPSRSLKLARRPAAPDELDEIKESERAEAHAQHEREPDRQRLERRLSIIDNLRPEQRPQVLIETRGEGGYVVVAPSDGTIHASGNGWEMVTGGPGTIPTLSVDERDTVYALAATLDQMPVADAPKPLAAVGVDRGARPGDDFNARATWDDILTPHGWQRVKNFGGSCWGWVRPGKSAHDGISGTTGRNDGDNLYVFSTSTEFEDLKPYSKFAAYTLLEHGGDYAAAARALKGLGYGTEPSRPVAPLTDLIGTHGNLATVTQLQPRPEAATERTMLHTDDANALALIDQYGDRLRFCSDRGRWYAWDGHVWGECARAAGPAREYAKSIARALPEDDKKDVDHKKRSLSAIGISATLTQAASDPRVCVTYDQLDAHPWELNTPGGIVDLRTGEMSPPDPDQLHTRSTACAPDFDADRSAWLSFLDVTFGGDTDLITYLQRLVGYSAVGTVRAHVLPYCYGSGGNGKGVFLETCVKVLGGYATTAPAGFLMAKTNPGHETEIARLAGARMVLCSEVNDDDRFDEARVKQLTGGDTLTARFMQQDHFTFEPTHQLWAMGNHQPHVRAGGRAFWRRLRLIPFLHEVPVDKIIDDLQGIFAGEHGPAVLAWIVEGAAAYHRHGLEEPKSVKAATGEYAHDQDTVTRFLEEMCRVGGGEHVTTKVAVVRSAYEAWCHEAGEEPVTAKALGLALRRHGIETTRTTTARMYVGLALIGGEENASWTDRDASSDSAAADQGWQ